MINSLNLIKLKKRHRNDLINVNGVALMSFWSMFIKFNRLFRSSMSQPKACDFAKKRLQCKSFSLSFAKFFRTVFVVVYVVAGHLRATAFTSSSTFIEWNLSMVLPATLDSTYILLQLEYFTLKNQSPEGKQSKIPYFKTISNKTPKKSSTQNCHLVKLKRNFQMDFQKQLFRVFQKLFREEKLKLFCLWSPWTPIFILENLAKEDTYCGSFFIFLFLTMLFQSCKYQITVSFFCKFKCQASSLKFEHKMCLS